MKPATDPALVVLERLIARRVEIEILKAKLAEAMMELLLWQRAQGMQGAPPELKPVGQIHCYLCDKTSLRRRSA